MSTKSQISIAALIFSVILISILIIFTDSQTRIQFQIPSFYSPCAASAATAAADLRRHMLKVFMYDLPRRFNFEMLNSSEATRGGVPPWTASAGIKRQHSVEYWMMASLMGGNGSDGEMEAVRVLDGDEAEVFFVPFFSSLSFNTHGKNMTDPDTVKDRQLQDGPWRKAPLSI